jgi:Fur family transcriptional regulator, ferric uptake regulator
MYHDHVPFKAKGLKATKQRHEIVEIIAHADYPLSAEEIYLELVKRGISLNLSTVYRTIETLVAKQVLGKVNLDNELKNRFELINQEQHHHHLICLSCNQIIAIEHCPLKSYENQIANKHHFTITNHKLDLYGYCEKCEAKV